MRKFNDVYEVLYKKYNDYMKKMRKRSNIYLILSLIISIILYFWAFRELIQIEKRFFLGIFILIGIIILIYSKGKGKYSYTFKTKIINELIKEFDPNLNFYIEGAIYNRGFSEAGFIQKYTSVETQDVIKGKLTENINMQLSEIKVILETKDIEGETQKSTIFKGMFAELKLNVEKDFPIVKIRKNNVKYLNYRELVEKIELESAQFEDMYDFYAYNPIEALKLFSIDVIEKIVEFKEKYNIKCEMSFKSDKIYLLFNYYEPFEIRMDKNALDYTMLYEYYKLVEMVGNIGIYFKKILEKK